MAEQSGSDAKQNFSGSGASASQEQRLEYLPGLGKVLPALVLIGVKRGPAGQASVSVGTEVETGAHSVALLDFEGRDLARATFDPASTRQGAFLMAKLELGALPRLFLVMLEEASGQRIPELTFGVDPQGSLAFPAPLHDPGTGGAAAVGPGQHLEPPGHSFPGVINVTRAVTTAAGVDLEVVLDDGGAGRVLLVTPLRRSRKKEDSRGEAPRPASPIPGEPGAAFLCKARIPLGTTHVRMRAAGADGTPIPGPSGTFDLVSLRFEEVVAAPAAASPPPSVPGAAASRKADLASISGLFGGDGLRRKEEAPARPESWPERIGENGRAIGPPGPVSGRPAIRLESAAEGRVRLRFDDGGLLRRIHLVAHGESLCVADVKRPTPSSPGIAELKNPGGLDELIFFSEDRFGTIVPNLSGRLLVGAREFRDYVPEMSVWHPAFKFRDDFLASKLPCLACGASGGAVVLLSVMDLTPDLRRLVREKFQPEPGNPPICDRCLARVETGMGWTKNPALLFQPQSLAFLFSKLVSAVVGALLPLTAQGLWLRNFMVPSADAAFERLVGNVALSCAGTLLMLAMPFNVFLRPALALAGVPRLATTSPPHLLLAASGLFVAFMVYVLLGPKPGLQAPDGQFLLKVTPLIVIGASVFAAAAGLAFERLESMGRWGLEESANPEERMGQLWRSTQQLLAVRNAAELERGIKVLAQEGFRATSFQICRWDEATAKLNATVTVGVKGMHSTGTSIAPAGSTIVAAAFEHGSPQTWHRLEQTGRARNRGQDPYREALLVVPLEHAGRPLMMLSLFELEGSVPLGELETVVEGLQVVIEEAIRRATGGEV